MSDTAVEEKKAGEMTEDEKLAAEWGASADADASAAPDAAAEPDADANAALSSFDSAGGDEEPGNTRILNQDEIDSLLGFDDVGGAGRESSGVMALVNNALVNYERLPMLDVVFDRLGRLLSTSLRNLTSDNVEASIDDITSVRFGDYLNSVPLPAMLAIFKAEEWDNQGLMVADSSLIYSIVDVLLGGRKGSSSMRIEGRPYTTIECNLMERMLHVTLNDLSAAFDPLSPVTFRFERLETNPRFAAITQSGNAAVLVKIRVDMDDRGGMLEVIIPYATLEPIRELLLQMFMGEKFGRDSIWENHLSKELYSTDVGIDAVLAETTLSLKDVMNWRIGSRLVFEKEADEPIEMRCGSHPMFTGKMGSRGDRLAVRLIGDIENEEEDR